MERVPKYTENKIKNKQNDVETMLALTFLTIFFYVYTSIKYRWEEN